MSWKISFTDSHRTQYKRMNIEYRIHGKINDGRDRGTDTI
jgi:hypothetical protein